MGRKSTRKEKNLFFKAREDAGLTRFEASDEMGISESRIERIEYEDLTPHPDEVLAMSRAYSAPAICNYYCSHCCEIGRENIPEIKVKNLTQSVLEMLASLNAFDEKKDLMIAVTADGKITHSELDELAMIRHELKRVSVAIDSFDLWIDDKIADGIIDKDDLEQKEKELDKQNMD